MCTGMNWGNSIEQQDNIQKFRISQWSCWRFHFSDKWHCSWAGSCNVSKYCCTCILKDQTVQDHDKEGMSLRNVWNFSPNVTEDWNLTFLWDLICSLQWIGVGVSEQPANLKMDTASSSETLVLMYPTAWSYIPYDTSKKFLFSQ